MPAMLSKLVVVAAAASANGLFLRRDMNATNGSNASAPEGGMDKKIPKQGVYESGYNEYGKEVLHKDISTHTDDWLNERYIGAHPAEEEEDMDTYTARICAKDTHVDGTYAAKNQNTEFCRLFLAGRQGLFLAQYAAGVRSVDPNLVEGMKVGDAGAVQDSKKYESDYVKDDRPNMTGKDTNVVFSYAKANSGGSSSAGPAEGTAPWYTQQCIKINDQCKVIKDHRLRIAELDRAHFESDYIRQKRILDNREANHLDQKADVAAQKEEVARAKAEVAAAKVTVKDHAHCPPELEAAKAALATLEATPNSVPADIDAECKAQQRVLDAQQCVEIFRAAEAVLAENQADLADDETSLHGEKKDVNPAAVKLPPQEQRVADALAAWNAIKAIPLSGSVAGIDSTCQDERNKIIAHAGIDLDALRAYWLKQKAILKGKQEDHNDEKGDVVDQKTDVTSAKAVVAKARDDVEDKAHCPPELESAEDQLAGLRAIANKSPADIDAECKAENRVLKAQKCVDELRAAEAILEHEKDDHDAEKTQLANEKTDVTVSKAALPPQDTKVAVARAALDAAMALMQALEKCRA